MASKAKESRENGGWNFVRQLRSDDIVYRKISTIHTQELVDRSRQSKFGQEIMSSAWSPDSNIFAWAVGTQFVSLHSVPQIISPAGGESNGVEHPNVDDPSLGRMLQLDCGQSQFVTCMCFGSRFSDKKWHDKEVNYNRFQEIVKNQLILATGLSNGDIKIWEVASGKLMMVLKDHADAVTDLKFAPDGSLVLVSASKDCSIKLWDLMDDGNMFKTLTHTDGSSKPVKQVAWSPDATRLATVGDGKLANIWEMKEFKLEQSLQGHQNDVTGCQFSDDGKLLYTSSFDTRVICWKVADGSRVRTFEHMSPPPSAIFAAGTNDHEVLGMYLRQNLLATICNDGLLRIWDVSLETETPVARFDVVPDARSLAFSDDGGILAVGCQGGVLQFYTVTSDSQ